MSDNTQQRHKRSRWYYIYFFLAALDVITVSASLYLNHQITEIYSESVRTNQAWAERLGNYSRLSELAGVVNAPGNDVFDTRDSASESARMLKAKAEFDAAFDLIRQDIQSAVSTEQFNHFNANLNELSNSMEQMTDEAKLIFSFFSLGQADKAGERMATMDRKYALVNNSISALEHRVRKLESDNLHKQLEQTRLLKKWEYVIAGLVLVMVGCAAYYGHSLSNQMSKAAVQMEQSRARLQASENRFRTLVINIPGAVYRRFLDNTKSLEYISEQVRELTGRPASDFFGHSAIRFSDVIVPKDTDKIEQAVRESIQTKNPFSFEYRIQHLDGTHRWVREQGQVVFDHNDKPQCVDGVIFDISDRKKAEKEREELQQQLLTASRQAGKAEIATGVLHNVGNVLNSVNISATLIQNKLLQSKAPNLGKAVNMLQEHHDDIARFLTSDDKGRQLPAYLTKLADVLVQEQNTLLSEIQSMNNNLDHVKKVVSAQQEYAKAIHVTEEFNLGALLEESIKISDASLERHSIKVIRKFEQNPQVVADKHLVFQILINLVTNAKKALRDSSQTNKCITLALSCIQKDGRDFVRLLVQDNGAGIPQENLIKIFTHGFTTRGDGHGFGLHSAANAARQMNGSLIAESPGTDLGSTFTLEIPLEPQRA